MIVLDAGAIIALIQNEVGASVVRNQLRANRSGCFIHAANLLEIYYNVERPKGTVYADRVLDLMNKAQIITVNDMDLTFLKDASHLKCLHRMALGDTFAVALARRLNAMLISTDRNELEPVSRAGLCNILFIR